MTIEGQFYLKAEKRADSQQGVHAGRRCRLGRSIIASLDASFIFIHT